MRRALSIFLVLLFGLGPLTATLDASDDARLPPCCRRHGAHRCSMSDALMARMVQEAHGKPIITAPAHCPLYPGFMNAIMTPAHALTSSPARFPVRLALARLPIAYETVASMSRIRTVAGRGPPVPTIG